LLVIIIIIIIIIIIVVVVVVVAVVVANHERLLTKVECNICCNFPRLPLSAVFEKYC
jgi:flagellar basal body-associated protein FliL